MITVELYTLASKTKVSFNGSVLDVNEGAGLLNDTLFIEIEGVAEPTLFVQLSMQGPLGGKESILKRYLSSTNTHNLIYRSIPVSTHDDGHLIITHNFGSSWVL